MSVRRVLVPANRPEDWPAGDWRAVPLADLEKFLATQRISPLQKSVLLRAEYSAVLTGNELTEGRLQWEIRRAPGETDLELFPFGLAVGDLNWRLSEAEQRPAHWGSTSYQRTALRLEESSDRLTGDWSLRGRKIGESVLFEAEFPKATATLFRLRLPDGWALRSSVGDVQRGPEGDWEVRMGGQTRAQWTAFHVADPQPPTMLVLQECEYRIRQDGLRLQTAITPEVLHAPVSELVLSIDPNLDVLSITAPEGTNLTWHPADSRGSVAVKLPEPLKGPGPRLLVVATGVFPSGRKALLPQIRVLGGQLMANPDDPSSGRIAVRVTAPLQLQDLHLQGCRQIDMSASSDEERFVFRQFDPESQIELQISPAQWRATARVLTWLDRNADTWLSRTACEWNVQAGTAFAVTCRVADGWDVIDVRGSGRLAEKPDWVIDEQEGERRLTVWFREPLSAGQSQRVFVDARRGTGPETLDLPVIVPRDVSQGQVVSGMSREDADRLVIDSDGSFTPLTAQPSWTELQALAEVDSRVPGTLWMQSLLLGARARITPRTAPQPAAATPRPRAPAHAQSPALAPVVSKAVVQARCVLDGSDVYRAAFHVQTDSRAQGFSLDVPEGTALSDARLNGQRVVPRGSGGRLEIPLPSNRTRHIVEVEYRAPVSESFALRRRRLLLPRVAVAVFGMTLTVEPGSDVWVGDLQGVSRESVDIAERWIGPFAELRRRVRSEGEDRPLRAFAADIPDGGTVAVCRRSRRTLAAWAVCGVTLLLGLILRLRPWPGRSLATSVALIGIAALTILLPESTAVFAGAANVGIWIAILFPHRWLVAPRPVPVQRAIPALATAQGIVVAGLALAAVLGEVSQAQDSPEGRFVILVPVDEQEQPAADAPLAYVPPELETLLRGSAASAESAWQLRSVRYELDADAVDRPVMTAVCSVSVRPLAAATSVMLPFSHVNLVGESACTVDGRPHPVLPGEAGGLIVVLEPEPAKEPEAGRAGVTHEIALRIYPQADPDFRGAVRMGLPACPTATLVRSGPAFPAVRVVAVQGSLFAVEAKLPEEGPLVLGPVSLLRLFPGNDAETRLHMGDVTAQAFTLCDLHPGLAYLQTRHVCRLAGSQVDAVSLVLPPEAGVRDVQAADLLRWDVTGSGAQRRLNVTWQRPQTGEFALRVLWTLPRPADSRTLSIAPAALALESGTGVRITALPQLFGWRRPGDMELDVSAAGDASALPRTPEQFQAGFPGETSRPASVLEANPGTGWVLEARPASPVALVRPRQTVSVFPDRLHVSLEATVEASAALLYQHQLSVPPEFTIEDVRVVQDGIEQPIRWSRLADSLVIFLRDRATDQVLHVSGVRSGNVAGEVPVALWTLEAVAADEPEVVVWQSPELRVDVEASDLSAIPFPPENIPPVGAGVSVGAYQARTSDPVRLQVAKADLRWSVDSVCEVGRQTDQFELKYGLRLSGDLVPGGSISLVLPPALAGTADLGGKDLIVLSRTRQAEGSERLEIGIPTVPGTAITLGIAASLPAPTEPFEVPRIEVPGAARMNESIVVRGPGLTLQGEPPARVRPLPGGDDMAQRFTVESPGGRGGRILVLEKQQSVALQSVGHTVYWNDGDRWQGRMTVTADGPSGRIGLSWPDGLRPRTVVVDGRVVDVPPLTDGRQEIPVTVGPRPGHEVLLAWDVAATEGTLPMPGITRARPGLSTVTFVPRGDRLMWMVGGKPRIAMPSPPDVPRSVVTTPLDGAAPALHSLDVALAQRGAAIFLAAGVGLIVVIASSWHWLQIIQSRPWLAAVLLAALWGLCLAPWWLGLVFPGVALVEALILWRRPPLADLPSTIFVTGQRA